MHFQLRVSSRLSGPVVPSFRALSGRLKFTVRRHTFNKEGLLPASEGQLTFGNPFQDSVVTFGNPLVTFGNPIDFW